MNRPFLIILSAYREESSGQISELIRFAEDMGLTLTLNAELETVDYKNLTTSPDSAIAPQNAILYMDKKDNPDIVLAIRSALTFNADGVIIKFGNNPMRGYIKNDDCYTAQEVRKAVEEIKRLAPLFGRKPAAFQKQPR